MIKEKEISFIKQEMEAMVKVLEKRDEITTQVIEELDKMLNLAKYGSVGHVNKVERLSTSRNYKNRITEVIGAFKSITDLQSIETLEANLAKVITESSTNLKNSNDSLNSSEVFSNDYIKFEILVKTYRELSDLYAEVGEMLEKVKASFVAENTETKPVVETKPEGKSA
jgi:hypothetical protein